jgi:hypothetical protein
MRLGTAQHIRNPGKYPLTEIAFIQLATHTTLPSPPAVTTLDQYYMDINLADINLVDIKSRGNHSLVPGN